MLEPRPHRAALAADEAAAELRRDVHAGRFDRDVVDAVLAAAGHRVGRRRSSVPGLTAREIDVLRLATRAVHKEIADRLVVTPKTVGNHIEHIYTKIGATNRAGAALFAMRNGLLPEDDDLDVTSG